MRLGLELAQGRGCGIAPVTHGRTPGRPANRVLLIERRGGLDPRRVKRKQPGEERPPEKGTKPEATGRQPRTIRRPPGGCAGDQDEDFRFALKELLAAHEPLLAEELKRARAPELLREEAL
jgi:hypothetical protein